MGNNVANIELASHITCTGCAACANVCPKGCISMVEDREGFLHPKIDTKVCIGCHKCEKTCPIINNDRVEKECSIIESYAFRLIDDEKLFRSSSGGAFYALAFEVIKNKGAVVGAVYNNQLEVVHSVARDMLGVEKMMGSKYVQSRIGDSYRKTKELLDDGVQVLFTGTPCQIDGLKHYLHHDYDNLLMVDLICHGVPSPLVFRDYIHYAEETLHTKLCDIRMRNKKYVGWGCSDNTAMIDKRNRFIMRDPRVVPWNTMYLEMLFVRSSCHNCHYCNVNRVGDFTIADYWDHNHKHDEVFSKKGTSLVFVNSAKAHHFFALVKQKYYFLEIPWRDMLQPRLQTAIPAHPNRIDFWRDYQKNGFKYCYNKYFATYAEGHPQCTIKRRLKRWIKDIVISGPWKFEEDLRETKIFKWVTYVRKFIKK